MPIRRLQRLLGRGLDRGLAGQAPPVLWTGRATMGTSESEVLAQELSNIAGQIRALEAPVKDVEAGIRGPGRDRRNDGSPSGGVSSHWVAVYRAMRRAELVRPTSW